MGRLQHWRIRQTGLAIEHLDAIEIQVLVQNLS